MAHGKPASRIMELVKDLHYPSDVAEELVRIVYGWKDETSQGKPFIDFWHDILQTARKRYSLCQIPLENLIRIEQTIIRNVGIMIKQEFKETREEKFFDLADAVKARKAQCLSYAMLVYILGSSLDFSVSPLGVTEIVAPGELPVWAGHNACLFKLADDRMMMVDLGVGPIISEPFDLEETYSKTGRYWELKDNDNPLLLDRRFTIEDKDWLTACIYVNMGKMSNPEEAIKYYDRALELSPEYADAYSNKGFACEELGRPYDAIFYYDQALKINPKDARTYFNRGDVWMKLGEYKKALHDYELAIRNHDKFPEAHFNRGLIYSKLGGYEDALFEFNRAIELNHEYTRAYFHRGMAFGSLGLMAEATADFTHVIEISPDFAEAYYNRGLCYIKSGENSKAAEDFSKVKELTPELAETIEKLLGTS